MSGVHDNGRIALPTSTKRHQNQSIDLHNYTHTHTLTNSCTHTPDTFDNNADGRRDNRWARTAEKRGRARAPAWRRRRRSLRFLPCFFFPLFDSSSSRGLSIYQSTHQSALSLPLSSASSVPLIHRPPNARRRRRQPQSARARFLRPSSVLRSTFVTLHRRAD